jgi:hypothetical protein
VLLQCSCWHTQASASRIEADRFRQRDKPAAAKPDPFRRQFCITYFSLVFFSLQVSQALQTLEQFSSREAQKRAALEAFDMPYAASCTRACKQFQSRGLPGVLSALPIFHYRQFSMPYLFLLLHRQRSLTVARNSKAHSRSAPIQLPNAELVNTISSFTKIYAFWSIKYV